MLYYKDDWDMAKKRTTAWYNREIMGRCAISVESPKNNVKRKTIPKPIIRFKNSSDTHYMLYSNL